MKTILNSIPSGAICAILLAWIGAGSSRAADYMVLKSFGNPAQTAIDSWSGLIRASDGLLYGTSDLGGDFSKGTVFRIREDGSDMRVIYSFTTATGAGQRPRGGLMQGPDGFLYGTTALGGANTRGSIFKVACDGSGYTQLYSFAASGDGQNPASALVRGPDGMLYGTTPSTMLTRGTAFRIGTDGSGYALIRQFNTTDGEGFGPVGELVVGPGDLLYGVAAGGGAAAKGVVFKMALDGSGYRRIYDFLGGSDGQSPRGLMLGLDGMLYGTTLNGGSANLGTVFRVAPDGSQYSRLVDFLGTAAGDGSNPRAALVQTADGALYGTTYSGGAANRGCVFGLDPTGANYRRLHDFAATDPSEGKYPQAPLLVGSDGALYGITFDGGMDNDGTIFTVKTDGAGYRRLWNFNLYGSDGLNPWATLLQARDGLLYGSCTWGGAQGGGSLFKFDPATAAYTVIYEFPSQAGNNQSPSTLIQGLDDQLYGMAAGGGSSQTGTVFRVAPNGQGFTLLHEFKDTEDLIDGSAPYGGLLQTSNGMLYGVTSGGGIPGSGVLFRMAADGTNYAILHEFGDVGDGAQPAESLVQGRDGLLYGTTYWGGTHGGGTFYRIVPDGSGYTILHHFGGTDGRYPSGPLLQAPDGLFYGVASEAGAANGGTVFRVAPDGTGFTVLHDFAGPNAAARDGATPYGALVQAADGTLFGVTLAAGAALRGTLFSLRPDTASFATLHHFTGSPTDGADSYGLLLVNGDRLYGMSSDGGTMGYGTLYRLTHGRTTATTLASSANPLAHRQALDLTATVSSQQGIPAGTVTLWHGTTSLGSATLDLTGKAVFHFAEFPNGTTALTAEYQGDPTFDPSLSPMVLQAVPNTPPVVQGKTLSLTVSPTCHSVAISAAELLANDTDPDGDTPSLATVDPMGAAGFFPVTFADGLITYTVPLDAILPYLVGQSGDDWFGYTVSDGYGGTTSGIVTVHVEFPISLAAARVSPTLADGKLTLSIAGMATLPYKVERSPDLLHWTLLDTVTMPAAGVCSFEDPAPPPGAAFYRVGFSP